MKLIALTIVFVAACGGVSTEERNQDASVADASRADASNDPDAAPVAAHIVFTTSSVTLGGIGDRLEMSAECQRVAIAAGRSETFVALVHLRTNPIDETYIAINGQVENTNGDLVAADAAEFFSGTFRAANNFSESGGPPGDTVAWVGDAPSGNTCGDWGSTAGQGGQTDVTGTTWLTAVSSGPCTLSRSIQCISQ